MLASYISHWTLSPHISLSFFFFFSFLSTPFSTVNCLTLRSQNTTTTTTMTATTTATVGSPFATTKLALRCLIKNHLSRDPLLVKLGHTKTTLHSPMVSQLCYHGPEPIISGSHKWRSPRIAATMASEEAVAATTQEAAVEVEEEEEEETAKEESGDDQVQVDNTKLYFGNLPYHCDSAQLAGIVQQYGTPELVEVLYDRETGKSRGFAFVTMSSIEDCNAVVENLDGSEYGGRYLRVNFADKPRKREPLYPETEHKLFVGNLSWSVTSESLYQAFQGYGSVVGARVLYDGETGRSRGYGFVSYATRSEMENALASLNGMELEGRAMRVSLAEGKKS